MTKQLIIEKTLKAINQLPNHKAVEICDFADFLFKKYEEEKLAKGMQSIISESDTFSFLKEDEEIYSINDLKEIFND
ncbi:MAG: hypothetical protein ABIP95_03795 [Pelobium sp.]